MLTAVSDHFPLVIPLRVPHCFLIEEFKAYEKVSFYTIRKEDEEESETDRFIGTFFDPKHPKFKTGYQAALYDLLIWIEEIGKRGMDVCSLRFENEANALPPDQVRDRNLFHLKASSPPLRLYCIPIRPDVMILCGGGVKTSQKLADSPDLRPHFLLANRLAKAITQKITEQDIRNEAGNLVGDLEVWI